MCARICGQNASFSNPNDQFLERVQINQNEA